MKGLYARGREHPACHSRCRWSCVDPGDPSAVRLYFQGLLPAIARCPRPRLLVGGGEGTGPVSQEMATSESGRRPFPPLAWSPHTSQSGICFRPGTKTGIPFPRVFLAGSSCHTTSPAGLGASRAQGRPPPARREGRLAVPPCGRKPESSFLVTQIGDSEVCGRDAREESRGGSYGSHTALRRDTQRFADGRSAPRPW